MCLPLRKYVVEHIVPLSLNKLSPNTIVEDPEISKRGARSRKGGGGAPPEIAKKSRIIFGSQILRFTNI
jgi:hypothetical protein